jgi:copper chaperone CopZ
MVAETTAQTRVKAGMNEQEVSVPSPFATSVASCACGEPKFRVSMPALVIDKAKDPCCCASEVPTMKVLFPTLPVVAPQGVCCSGVKLTSKASAPAPIINETKGPDGLDSVTFRIDGASCSCEGQIVEKRVKALKGVKTFSLNPITNQMKLTYDPSALSVQDIQGAMKKAGATAVLVISR